MVGIAYDRNHRVIGGILLILFKSSKGNWSECLHGLWLEMTSPSTPVYAGTLRRLSP